MLSRDIIGIISGFLENVPQRVCIVFKQGENDVIIDGIDDGENRFVVVKNEETDKSYKIQLFWSQIFEQCNIVDEKIIAIK